MRWGCLRNYDPPFCELFDKQTKSNRVTGTEEASEVEENWVQRWEHLVEWKISAPTASEPPLVDRLIEKQSDEINDSKY